MYALMIISFILYIIFARQKVKQLYISNFEFPPHKRVKCKQSVNKRFYPVYKSPKNVVYSDCLLYTSDAADEL